MRPRSFPVILSPPLVSLLVRLSAALAAAWARTRPVGVASNPERPDDGTYPFF